MLNEPTIDKLHALHLGAMAAAWTSQREDVKINEIDFDTRFGMIVDAEHLARDNKRLVRALREAKLRLPNACLEDVDFSPKRELDRAAVRQLGTCAWIASHANVIITGATGTGKSYLACALAHQACRTGRRVAYRRMPRLLEELALAHADGTYTRLLGRLAKTNVLVLDDWGLAPLREQERRDLLEIFEDRHGVQATIFTSQLPVEKWLRPSDHDDRSGRSPCGDRGDHDGRNAQSQPKSSGTSAQVPPERAPKSRRNRRPSRDGIRKLIAWTPPHPPLKRRYRSRLRHTRNNPREHPACQGDRLLLFCFLRTRGA